MKQKNSHPARLWPGQMRRANRISVGADGEPVMRLGKRLLGIITLLGILCSFLISSLFVPLLWPWQQGRAASLGQTIPADQTNTQHLPLIKTAPSATGDQAIVFVSRQIPQMGTVYWNVPKGMPGVGPFSRFQVAAPGQLLVREANGTIRVLVDGAKPTAASLNLIDVNAPEVSYDGQRIVFAGLVAGNYDRQPMTNPGGWRLYIIHVDGSGLRQLTFSDQDNLNLSQFGDIAGQFRRYDDTDPVWLPDGRLFISWAPDINQDYGLYLFNPIGGEKRLIYDKPGTTELRARIIQPRPLPPVIADDYPTGFAATAHRCRPL